MAYVDFMNPAIAAAQKATEYDKKKNYPEALKYYTKAVSIFITGVQYEKNIKRKKLINEKSTELLRRAEQIKTYLKEQEDNDDPTDDVVMIKNPKKVGEKKQDREKKALESALSSVIVQEKPNVKWEDVAGLETAKKELKEAAIMPNLFPQLFGEGREPWRGILLYGPPGTGKSFLAKALATEAKSTFFAVSSADIVSKYVGESARLCATLFDLARKNKPSIIFIDEVDSMCGQRSEGGGGGGGSEAGSQLKTQFLVEMQGVDKDNDQVLVLGATNLPMNLDKAMRRRFERRIYVPLPDLRARQRLLELFIKVPHNLRQEELLGLARRLSGFSGSDISIFVRNAVMEPVRKCLHATHFKIADGFNPLTKKEEKGLWTPCRPRDEGAQQKTIHEIDQKKLLPPKVELTDFLRSMESSKPSVCKEDLLEYEDWTKKFGIKG